MAIVYDVGDTVKFTGTFTDTNGDLANPSTLSFVYRAPTGDLTTYVYGTDAEVVQESVGVYSVSEPMTIAGDGFWRWIATGTVAESDHGYFLVRAPWTNILSSAELDLYVETDLTLAELDAIIAAESAYLDFYIGSPTSETQFFRHVASPDSADRYYSDRRYSNPKELTLNRPAQSITTVVERDEDEVSTTLAADDYRLLTPYMIERRDDGTNQRADWGPEVTVTYIPQGSLMLRRQALIDLCKISVAQNGYQRIQDREIQLHRVETESERVKILSRISDRIPFL